MPILGMLQVNVHHQQNEVAKLNLYVFNGKGPNLLGRNWLNVIKLNWNNVIKTVSSERLNNLEDSSKLSGELRILIDKHS